MACWIGARPPQQRGPLHCSQHPRPTALGTQDCSVAELSGPGSWLLRPVRRGIKVWGSAPCVSTRAAALWGEDGAQSRLAQTPSLGRRPLRRVSGKRRERRGQTGAPVDAPPAASQAAPPRGDEALAVKMEVTCLLLLALIPFHCRGQGVYGKSQRPAPPWRSRAETLQDLAQSARCQGLGGAPGLHSRTDGRVSALAWAPGDRAGCSRAQEPILGYLA